MGEKPKKTAALLPRNHYAATRWRVDWDYVSKLNAEEKQWLADFAEAHYGGHFPTGSEKTWPTGNRSDVNRDKNAGRSDVLTCARLINAVQDIDVWEGRIADSVGDDTTPTPEYLSTPEYKAAVAKFRDQLQKGRVAKDPHQTLAYKQARRALVKMTPGLENNEDEN